MKTYTLNNTCRKCGKQFTYTKIAVLPGRPRAFCGDCKDYKTRSPPKYVVTEG